ncbi:hypothetical protein EV363DRAFT_1174852 [Boletus edulis]|nr:hypothetical protein EV363DRAFT_1174852 [Boletus edulis]
MSNPALEVCPDYNSEPNEPLRLAIIDRFGLDEQQAVTRLNEIWEQDRARRVVVWDQQRAEQQRADELAQQEERAEEEERIHLEQDEAEKERKEAEKKKPKINDFDSDLPPPSVIIPRPSQYAIQKITSFEFVEMWYFSPDGCSEAARNHRSQADDALGLSATNDILTLRPVASVKASKNARPDYELSFNEFLQAKNSYLHHIKQVSWPDKHVNALAEFFWNLENHPIRSNLNGDLVALHYAARIRRQWHDDLKNNTGKAFNISIINENLMNALTFEVNSTIQAKVEALIDPRSTSPTRSRRPIRRAPSSRVDPIERRRSSRSSSPRQRFRPPPSYQTTVTPSSQQHRSKATGERATKSVCPKCLGRNPHRILECNSPTLWSGGKCFVTRTNEGRLVDPKGEVLCTDWQRPNGCSLVHRSAKHNCSGCGSSTHGAQACDLAQAFASALTI